VRLLYWSELFWPYVGGPELFARKLLPVLRGRGYEITVVTSQDHLDLPDRSELTGIPVHRLPMRAALASAKVDRLADVARRIERLKRDVAPDLIHISGVGPSAVFHLLTEHVHPAPLLVSLRTEVLRSQCGRNASLLERVLHRGDWTTAVSLAVLEQARQLVPDIAARSSVVHNFVDAPERPVTAPSFDPPRLLCLGRLIADKGFDLAVQALPAVLARHPRARMVIGGDGPERTNLGRLAQDLGVDHAVDFAGPIAPDDVPDLLDGATLVLIPSRREGLPMVAIEAGMMARPVVAARTGGLPEAVVDGQTGMLVPREDVNALADAMCTMLARPSVTTDMGWRAGERARVIFDRDRCVDAYVELYERLDRQGRPAIDAAAVAPREDTRGRARATLS
jgi:glycogen(starch) synthase